MAISETMRTPLSRSDTSPPAERSSIPAASAWMVVISIALFFVPVLNGLIGGLVGGYKAGGVRRALIAAILPAVVLAIAMWVILALLSAPIIGFFAGAALGLIVLFADLGLFIGAAIGGAMSSRR
jgi:hypothetical protein